MTDIREAHEILVKIFSLKNDDPERNRSKKEALERMEETFPYLTQNNFADYSNYLQEWTLNEIDVQSLQLFVKKLRLLHEHLKSHSHVLLCEKLFPICFHLLQHEDQQTRQEALLLVLEALASSYGAGYTKNTVKKLLGSPYSYGGFDCALTIFSQFRQRFSETQEFAGVLGHPNLFSCYKSKKVLTRHLVGLALKDMTPMLTELIMTISGSLLADSQENIRVAAIKANTLVLLARLRMGLDAPQVCFEVFKTLYESRLIRVKYVLLEITQQVTEINLPGLVQEHFEFMKNNISKSEPELTELTICNLKFIFGKVSQTERAEVLGKLLGEKRETRVEGIRKHHIETIAINIIDLLIKEESEEALVDFLNKFVKDKPDSVKIVLAKSFFKHEKSKHLFVYFRLLLTSLYESTSWRVRHQSLEVLEDVIEAFGVDESTMEILYNMVINDKAYRIRTDGVQLLKRHLDNSNIRTYLLPMIANEYMNQDYLRRMVVLELIRVLIWASQETYHMLVDSASVLELYRHVMKELVEDPVQNVSELARSILAQVMGVE